MPFIYAEVTFTIYNSYSLKDKRSTVKSILKRMHQKYNVSLAEVAQQEMLNVGCIGMAAVNSSALVARQIINKVIHHMEEEYEIEIFEMSYE